jgi:hypothetical protein
MNEIFKPSDMRKDPDDRKRKGKGKDIADN